MQTTVDLKQDRNTNGKAMKYTFAPESKPLEGYTIKRAIERGGFGEVYYALSDAGKEVALKLVQETNQDIELRGVSQCLNLKHPNLLSIFDIRQDEEGDSWVVMEFISGDSLSDALNQSPNGLTTDEIKHWLNGIVNGIEYLHDRGIVHRDLKPANIYSEAEQVKVGDVGLSKFIAPSHHSATQSVGTVYYMAPEVAKGRYGKEIDVYSLGIMLFEMLTGRVPFDGESTAEILMKHLSEKPDLSVLPRAYRGVIERALEKDPTKRTPSVRKLLEEFEAANSPNRRKEPTPIPEHSFVEPHPRYERANHNQDGGNPFRQARYADRNPNQFTPIAVIGVITIILLCISVPPLGVSLALGFGLWALIRAFSTPAIRATQGNQPRPKPKPVALRKVVASRANYPLTPETPRKIDLRDRVSDLTGSLTFAPFVAALLAVPVGLSTSSVSMPADFAMWLLPSLVATWSIIAAGKIWEGHRPDSFRRRVMLMLLGAATGFGVFGLSEFLFFNFNSPLATFRADPGSIYGHGNWSDYLSWPTLQPRMSAYVLFFAMLFGLRRWWYHVDSFRSRRIRISSIVLTTALGYLLSLIFNMPSGWATAWAATTSALVQLSSGWTHHDDRKQIVDREENVGGVA